MKMYTGIKALTVMFWITFMFGKPCLLVHVLDIFETRF